MKTVNQGEKTMTMTNGHSVVGARRILFGMAMRQSIAPNFTSIARAAGLSPTTVCNAFGAPGMSVNAPHNGTMAKIAEALDVSLEELRRLHAALQLEEAPKPPPASAKVAKVEPILPPAPVAPAAPRNLWAELCEAAMDGAVVIVASHSPDRGQSIARGIVASVHEEIVAIHAHGDNRPVRIRREHVKDVRRVGAEATKAKP